MIEKFFESEYRAVNKQLEAYFRNLNKRETDSLFNDFIIQFKDFILNDKAKRLHPVILIAAFSGIINPMYLEDKINEIRKVSIAVELLHNAHLIQDDLIDNDEVRRGVPTFHRQMKLEIEEIYRSNNHQTDPQKSPYFGRDMGILGGTYAYVLGMDIIKNSNFQNKLKLMAVKEYTEAVDYLLKGQIIEEYMNYHNLTMSLEQYLNIAEMLRARVFEKSARIGAILAKGNIHYQINPLSEAMLRIGQSYAIRDDILDMRDDIRGKKKKIIYILAVQNTNEEQSKKINEIYNKEKITDADVDKVERIFGETNAVVIAEHLSKNLVSQAKTYLKDVYPDLNKQEKEFFNEFADFIYLRQS
ncbi:MAG: hypothetical protein GF317_21720 [Candidatus Lokiarchaeota archaeon]|nr:hypothetical protein [Candidatus Lokiarchaeota archaeon]MBD3202080.1 hypothetical protein [Candidatus Lokiarchaeota archaeon]